MGQNKEKPDVEKKKKEKNHHYLDLLLHSTEHRLNIKY